MANRKHEGGEAIGDHNHSVRCGPVPNVERKDFPSGSHKVGAAYVTLMEGELAGEIDPTHSRIIGPSTGNFGIGVAYIAKLMGYPAVIIMPEEMSAERYQRIQQYGGELDLTPGSESDVILVLERTQQYKEDSRNKVLPDSMSVSTSSSGREKLVAILFRNFR